ncbi:protein FRG1 [Sporothrix schenckii 1099-18]|uniref:Protein FRG1 n=2 Tax=Sporothrix schenckii TaxID=29908 RepID=U7Q1L1_SPOS1|nr:protein FRG1 [Sporothrix schenckii 1099-18]ERT01799.1 hypothetical protein HMPREF1624_00093 [Sporothrix schenckii ATCC 58251]KJR81068.1 protein FRG1 [Sporothrix schenckii 1099-18]
MVKPLTFKGDKKVKKRKHRDRDRDREPDDAARKRTAVQVAGGDETVADDDTWVSAEALGDVSGPVLIVLPGTGDTKPAALACDANGKVFAMAIENIVDGNPASAEPHDVRQVWVASRVVGTEHFLFKGHHGKYLGCDKYGLFSATSIAVSPLESFVLVDAAAASATQNKETEAAQEPDVFQIKTLRDTFLSVQPHKGTAGAAKAAKADAVSDVRGDAAEAGIYTGVRIRMQARFKPRIKASKEEKAREKISRRELETAAGRRLEDDEVKLLKRARRDGDYHERLLDLKVKGKSDTYA